MYVRYGNAPILKYEVCHDVSASTSCEPRGRLLAVGLLRSALRVRIIHGTREGGPYGHASATYSSTTTAVVVVESDVQAILQQCSCAPFFVRIARWLRCLFRHTTRQGCPIVWTCFTCSLDVFYVHRLYVPGWNPPENTRTCLHNLQCFHIFIFGRDSSGVLQRVSSSPSSVPYTNTYCCWRAGEMSA